MLRRSLVLAMVMTGAVALTGAAVMLPAQAATQAVFTPEAFAAAQNAGKPILVKVDAPWCPYCAKQRPIIDSLKEMPSMKDLVIFAVDFDSQKDALKILGVTKQSTLIAFHGKVEKDRSTGITEEDAIKALMLKTVA